MQRGGLRYHYLDEGAGDPVLMLHGNPTWSFYYRNMVAALRDTYRCIVPDHIGCGYSDKPGDEAYNFTLASRIDDLAALVEHLQLGDKLTLMLHDWGGMIGMAYAVRHPEKIKRLVLFNTAAFHLPPTKPMPWMLSLVRDTALGAYAVRYGNAFARGAAWVGCTRQRMPRALRDAYCAPYDSPHNRLATLRFVQDIPLQPGDPAYAIVSETQAQLAQFQALPTLICWGMRDFVFDHHFLREWQHYLPQAETHEFEDSGHYVLEDASAEIIPLVQQFLAAHPL